jgi:glycine/D-amino acid oxidase-like deaminating enzyme
MILQQNINRLSYWERSVFFDDFQTVVLGSGIVGLNAALHLRKLDPSRKVLVIERGAIPSGASTKNAGFACYGSMTELLDDLKKIDEATVWGLVERRFLGLQRVREKIGDDYLRYEGLGGYELFRADESDIFLECQEYIPAFNKMARSITGLNETYRVTDEKISNFGFKGVEHLILNAGEGQINTGYMMQRLLQLANEAGVQIINGLEIKRIEPDQEGITLHTQDDWSLHFEQCIVATNGFARQLLPDLDVSPARNQVLITPRIPNLPIVGSFHYDRGYYYFRNIDGRLLLGGGRNLAPVEEQTDAFGHTELIQKALLQLLNEVILPGQNIPAESWWSGIMGLGERKVPILQKISPNLVVAVRMGGMGVAIGTLVGEEAAELLIG